MKRALQLIIAMSLFVCTFNLNAQNDSAPGVKVVKERGGVVIQLDNQYHYPYDVSDNGQHVAIQSFEAGVSYYWSEATGLVQIDGYATAVSDEGIVAGYYPNPTFGVNAAGLWSPETREWEFLGMNPDYPEAADPELMIDYNNAWAMTNDGSTVAVMHADEDWNSYTYLWTEEDGYEKLAAGNYTSSRPMAISNDASVLVGHAVADMGWIPCYWLNGEFHEVGTDIYGEAMGVSSEGQYICGYIDDATPMSFTYDIDNDELSIIENTLSPGNAISANCINNNGEAFGYYAISHPAFPDTRRAFAYIGDEMMDFADYLAANNFTEALEWTMYSVNTVTADGTTFSAAANIDGIDYSLVIVLEESECDGPTNLTYTMDDANYNDVVLNWEAPENPVDVTYEIYDSYTATEPLVAGITETTYTLEDLEAGQYTFLVKANWGGECLSSSSNTVRVTINPCPESEMCQVRFEMIDSFGDGWNNGYIEVSSLSNDLVYQVTCTEETEPNTPVEYILNLCPDTYMFTWVAGQYDEEIGFSIFFDDEEIYSVEAGGITPDFVPLFLDYEVDCGTAVNEIVAENGIAVMPNPARDYFNIEGENIVRVEISNALGQIVDVINVENDNVQISTDNYNNGIYFVKVATSDAQVSVKKIVVSK